MISGPCTGTSNEPTGFRVGKFFGAVGGTFGGGYLAWDLLKASNPNVALEILIIIIAAGLGNQMGRGLGAGFYHAGKGAYDFFAKKCHNPAQNDQEPLLNEDCESGINP